jgi:hypothetical protein
MINIMDVSIVIDSEYLENIKKKIWTKSSEYILYSIFAIFYSVLFIGNIY